MRLTLMFLAITSVAATADAQTRSLRELVRQHQGGMGISSIACGGMPPTPAIVAARSDVLVHGIVERTDGALTADEEHVITTFVLRPIEVHRRDRINWSSTPPEIALQAIGGVALVDGFRVTESNVVLGRTIDVRIGQEVVLLAKHGDEPEQLIFDAFGTFVVESGFVRATGDRSRRPEKAILIEAFLAELRQALTTGVPMRPR